ncbi:hypothetical protein CDAR_53131 [Caerostris darwini]|uniref:Uncharacterized protein n=1 Tax=Caerostris darwini TaxID=1538125 RepID=A0AAV4QQX2_9ARAC|nr:hypothetical protein CDAR_53131 [Caerostris darwini]
MLMLRHPPQHGAPALGDPHHLAGPPVDLSGHYAAFGQTPFTHSWIDYCIHAICAIDLIGDIVASLE